MVGPAGVSTASSDLGVYVHVPYCRRKCGYCDFYSLARDPDPEFARAVGVELAQCDRSPAPAAALRPGRSVATVYFGGGTPSLIDARALGSILDAIDRRFALQRDAEITVEVNPATVDQGALQALRATGVNRLSIGVQSLDDRWLAALGRLHDARQAIATVAAARGAGFDSVGVDLILAIPGQTASDSAADVAAIAALGAPHLSAYLLTLEPGTPLQREVQAGRLTAIDDDLAADMLEQAVRQLAAAGLARYEISNFARPGAAARHNRRYWSGGEVLGLGPGAHSNFKLGDGGGLRYANPDDVDRYLVHFGAATAPAAPFARSEDRLEPSGYLLERLYLGLRDLERGVDLDDAADAAGLAVWPALEQSLIDLAERGLLRQERAVLRLTTDGARLADLVAVQLLAALPR